MKEIFAKRVAGECVTFDSSSTNDGCSLAHLSSSVMRRDVLLQIIFDMIQHTCRPWWGKRGYVRSWSRTLDVRLCPPPPRPCSSELYRRSGVSSAFLL